MHFLDNFRSESIERQIQSLIDTENTAFMEILVESLNERDPHESTMALFLEIWLVSQQDYVDEEARIEAVILMLEERQMPYLPEGEELYVGEFDDQGRRNGFGVIFYGEGVKLDSVMYVGNFVNGQRSGEGIAYNSSGAYMSGTWSNDLPNGRLRYIEVRRGYVIECSFSDGLGYGIANYYGRGGSLDSYHFVPKSGATQTFESRPDLFDWTDPSGSS